MGSEQTDLDDQLSEAYADGMFTDAEINATELDGRLSPGERTYNVWEVVFFFFFSFLSPHFFSDSIRSAGSEILMELNFFWILETNLCVMMI